MPFEISEPINSMVDLAQILIRSQSTKGNTVEVAQIVKAYFQQFGLEATVQEYTPREANVYLKIGPPNTPVFLISGHLDTVPAGDLNLWQHPPFSGDIIDGALWGRGAVDMKGGLAMLADIMVELSKRSLKQQILFVATAEEETGLFGSKHMITEEIFKEDPISHILIAEPTGAQPIILEKGVMWIEISCIGKQSHGSRPDLGVNAVWELMAVLQKIPTLFPEETHELVGGTTMNITTFKGGDALNVGAESARVTVDIRIPPGVDNNSIQDIIRTILEENSKPDLLFEMKVLYDEPAIISPDTNLAKQLAKKTWQLTGHEPDIGAAHYTTDGTVFMNGLASPVPYAIFGPGSTELLHQSNEKLELKELYLCRNVIFNTLLDIVGTK